MNKHHANNCNSKHSVAPLPAEQSVLRDVCVIMFIVLLVFGINNFLQSNNLLGYIDVGLALFNLLNAWRLDARYKTAYTGGFIVLLSGSFAVLVAATTNSYGIFWSYVVSAGAFLVVERRAALAFNCLFIPAAIACAGYSADTAVGVRVGATLSLVTVFAYIFASRIQEQSQQVLAHAGELERANAAKSEFIANMSHEMRTPLTTVMGYSEGLLQQGGLDSSTRERLGTIASSAKSLSVLIDDVLDLSRMGEDRLSIRYETFELQQYCTELTQIWTEAANRKGLKFELLARSALPRFLHTDRIRLNQILSNLLANAFKFTDTGSVELVMDYAEQDRILLIQVIDTGIGVPCEFQDKLFQQFTQADTSMTRNYHGVGLGLHISHSIAALLNAELEYIAQDKGSLFQLKLHLEERPTELLEAEEVYQQAAVCGLQDQQQFSGNILIVEDSISIQLLVGLLAEQMGVTHRTCNNGLEAIESLAGESFDLILMDLQMPVMSGIEATQRIRETGNDIPIIALSADVLLYDNDSEELSGFSGLLGKPLALAELRQTFARYLPIERELQAVAPRPATTPLIDS